MQNISYQKTLHGRSANQILRNATISVMRAGNVEITISDMPGVVAQQDNDGDLVLADIDGVVAGLLCGVRAKARLVDLSQTVEVKQCTLLDS